MWGDGGECGGNLPRKQAEVANTTHMVMDINVPDDTTGDLMEFAMDMTITQDVGYRLVGSSSA